jgi:hypothetical protein
MARSSRGPLRPVRRRLASLAFCAATVAGLVDPMAAAAQGPSSAEMDARIRQEEAAHSQLMRTEHVLTDVYGPRLTGSPNAKAAGAWAIAQLTDWGLSKGHLEPWSFGHPGWTNERASGYITWPVRDQLTFKVEAWTPGTHGPLTAGVVVIDPPAAATRERLARYLDTVRDRVRNRIVLVGAGAPLEPEDSFPARLDDKLVAEMLHPAPAPAEPAADAAVLSRDQATRQVDAFLMAAGAVMRVNDARLPNGAIRAFDNPTFDPKKALPTVILRHEDFGRIVRIAADGTPPTLSFDIQNRLWPEGRTAYNAIAEIPGTDKADEIVMLGAHLDSWHSATGATDDASGCAMMMEAVRILTALGVHPRRTIRIALWTGEEQYLLGSQDYVARHFGTAEAPGPDFYKLAAYVNIDGGTGRIRGANIFGPAQDADGLAATLAPFADLGFVGAVAHGKRKLRSTDATTFSRAGLPAIGLMQDPMDYGVTWHSNFDTYDHVVEGDAKSAAVVIAALVYDLAMRDAPPARFESAEMPSPEGPAPSSHPAPNVE